MVTNDLKTSVAGAVGLLALAINHYVGISLPIWVLDLIAGVAASYFVYLTNKKDVKPQVVQPDDKIEDVLAKLEDIKVSSEIPDRAK
jgi:hypothetical protein